MPDAVKKTRLYRLQQRITEMEQEISAKMVGTVQKVLVERASKRGENQVAGRTENNRIVRTIRRKSFLVNKLLIW